MSLYEMFLDRDKRRYLILGLSWLAIFVCLFWIRSVLLPFILAILLAYVLDPIVSKITTFKMGKHRVPRYLAVVATYCALFGIFALIAVFFVPQLFNESVRLVKLLVEWANSVNEAKLQAFGKEIDRFLLQNNFPAHVITDPHDTASDGRLIEIDLIGLIDNFTNEVVALIRAKSTDIVGLVQTFIGNVLQFSFEFVLVFMLAAFILADTKRIKRFAFMLVPRELHTSFEGFLHRLDKGVSGVVRGQLIICFINAILTLIGLLMLDVKFALILATLAGVLSLIPIFGSILSSIPIVIIALMKSPSTALLALAWIVFIHALEANFLNPKIMGSSAQIHPVLVVLALVAGEHYFGIAGALLAVPTASILLNTFNSILIKGQS